MAVATLCLCCQPSDVAKSARQSFGFSTELYASLSGEGPDPILIRPIHNPFQRKCGRLREIELRQSPGSTPMAPSILDIFSAVSSPPSHVFDFIVLRERRPQPTLLLSRQTAWNVVFRNLDCNGAQRESRAGVTLASNDWHGSTPRLFAAAEAHTTILHAHIASQHASAKEPRQQRPRWK